MIHRREVLSFVFGIRGERKNPVTARQIERYFETEGEQAISDHLDSLMTDGLVRICKTSLKHGRSRRGYVYEFIKWHKAD